MYPIPLADGSVPGMVELWYALLWFQGGGVLLGILLGLVSTAMAGMTESR